MNTQKKTDKAPVNWDKSESTYFWNIWLNQNNINNHVKYLSGYSKAFYQREKEDKDELLKLKCAMFLQNDFLNPNRIEKIEIFMKVDETINKKTDPLILILYPDRYELPELNRAFMLKKFGYFLEEFYKRKKAGLSLEGLIQRTKKTVNPDDYLNPDIKQFKSLQNLYSYSVRLLNYGHPPGAVESFINKVKTRNNW